MTDPDTTPPVRKGGTRPALIVLGVLVLAAGAFGLYEMARPTSKNVAGAAHSGPCARSLDLAKAIEPLVHGEVAGLMVATKPNSLDQVAFDDAAGKMTTVGAFKGKAILLNLWATWCVPCRAEMPSLDRLQAAAGSDDFSVVPINVDTTRLEKARGFLSEINAKGLPFYSDKTAGIIQALKQGNDKVTGLPTTILVGGDGCEIATMAGPAAWDSPDATTLIERIKSKGGTAS